jgi:hypothetical protein
VVADTDEWLIFMPGRDEMLASRAREWLAENTGTVVVWQKLDRVLPERRPEGGWARRRLDAMAARTVEHLGMVFHRFLEGVRGRPLVITVNGEKVEPWNPFAPGEPGRLELPPQRFEVAVGDVNGEVWLHRSVLPSRDQFSSPEEFERLSGPLNWNRQQGLYIYRADRLVQWGGWNGVRGIDEHTKLARASLDFDTDLPAGPPGTARTWLLEHDTCSLAPAYSGSGMIRGGPPPTLPCPYCWAGTATPAPQPGSFGPRPAPRSFPIRANVGSHNSSRESVWRRSLRNKDT